MTADALLVGAARSGTTVLADTLARSPEVALSTPKETHFLTYGAAGPNATGPGDEIMLNQQAIRTLEDWEAALNHLEDARCRIDASASFFHHSVEAAGRIVKFCPEAKVVVLLREPLDRAFSAYQFQRSRGFETLPFMEALVAEEQRVADGYQHLWHYADAGHYGNRLRALQMAVGAERLHIAFYERLVEEPARELHAVGNFLGIDPTLFPTDLGPRVNVSGVPRNAALGALFQWASSSAAFRSLGKRVVPKPAREAVRRKLISKEELHHSDELLDRFFPYLEGDRNITDHAGLRAPWVL